MLKRRLFCAGLVLTILGCGFIFGQGTTPTPTQQLYMLAGTPDGDWGYPVTLYRADTGKLKVVREVLSQYEGLRSVQAWRNVIFLLHSVRGMGTAPRAISIIDSDEPLLVDNVVVESFGTSPDPYHIALGEPRASVIDYLLPMSDGIHGDNTLVSVSGDARASGPRVRVNDWNEYATLRLEGNTGGPAGTGSYPDFFVMLVGNRVFLPPYGHAAVKIDSLPSSVINMLPPSRVGVAASGSPGHRLKIIVASQQYLLLGVESYKSEELGNSLSLFAHDRVHDRWKAIQIEGNTSRSRLFGSWLVSIVEMYDPSGKPSPGRGNERGSEAFGDYEIAGSKGNDGTARFPIVRDAYFPKVFTPGILVLQNLEDGRKIRIETNQEDSEILSVAGDTVIYRVNDTIYQAKIVGDKLQNRSVVVKYEDVPEIHWVFWSK